MSSIRLIQQLLLSWYGEHQRALPWREKLPVGSATLRDPYRVLVSELMLQQTQASRVIPLFLAFLSRWPTIGTLVHASLADILRSWKGLGYNRRAKYLLETTKIVVHNHSGVFPQDSRTLKSLPGFGPYMVGALKVFAFGQQEIMIDVNVSRILSRVFVGQDEVSKKEVEMIALQALPKGQADDWHQALMDFGSSMCTKNSPKCARCFLRKVCMANRQATAKGYQDFAHYYSKHKPKKIQSPKDNGKKFIETDRYFRGKIIDHLREKNCPMKELQSYVCDTLLLQDRVRFGRIIESLVIDGLISVRGTLVSLD